MEGKAVGGSARCLHVLLVRYAAWSWDQLPISVRFEILWLHFVLTVLVLRIGGMRKVAEWNIHGAAELSKSYFDL